MELLTQPKGSSYCAQYAWSMALGVEVEEMFEELGKPESGTNVNQYKRMLSRRGKGFLINDWPDNRRSIDLRGKGILCVTNRARNWGHAVAFEDGKIYDPSGKVFDSAKDMKRAYKPIMGATKIYYVITLL